MLLLQYRSLPDGTSLPVDQRWRTTDLADHWTLALQVQKAS